MRDDTYWKKKKRKKIEDGKGKYREKNIEEKNERRMTGGKMHTRKGKQGKEE